MITKPTSIVTSLGRTGTKFFAALFGELLPDSTSIHEPDVFNIVQYDGLAERTTQVFKQLQEVGTYNLLVRKPLGRWSLTALSDARVRGELTYTKAVKRTLDQRREFVSTQEGSVYAEASVGYYGLIDVLKQVYTQHRIAYIVRDGRNWVRSNMNWGQMYGKGRIRSLMAHTWPTAPDVREDPYAARWGSMSRFERLCWAWARLNQYALSTMKENENARLFRFEDIFESEARYRHFLDVTRFLTAFPDVEPISPTSLAGWLDRRIHNSQERFPSWEEWSADQKRQFRILCGPLMKELGYAMD